MVTDLRFGVLPLRDRPSAELDGSATRKSFAARAFLLLGFPLALPKRANPLLHFVTILDGHSSGRHGTADLEEC